MLVSLSAQSNALQTQALNARVEQKQNRTEQNLGTRGGTAQPQPSRAQPARGGSPQPGGPHGPKAEWHERQHIGKEGNIGTGGKGLTGGRQPPLAGSSGSSDQGRADPQRSVTAGGARAHPPVSPSARGYPLLPSRVPRQRP